MKLKETTHYEGSEQVYPCRCGETHRGDYALYEFGHHECFHNAPLLDMGTSDGIEGYLACPDCGKTFSVKP